MKVATAILLPAALAAACICAGCGMSPGTASTPTATPAAVANSATPTPPPEVDMGSENFYETTLSVASGTPVTFKDLPSGDEHILCIGQNGACDKSANGPKALMAPGFTIEPGATQQVTFTTAGIYKITCTIHPSMNLTLTVK